MLKFLRNKKTQKQIYIVLAIAVIPAFIFWGVLLSKDEGDIPTVLGRIDNRTVSVKEYLASYRAIQHQVAMTYGEKSRDIARLVNFKGEAWDRLLLLHYAKKEKIKVSDPEVVSFLKNQPLFVQQGEFNPAFYKKYVSQYLRLSTREFEEEIRQMLTLGKIQEKLRLEIVVTEEELKKMYDLEKGEAETTGFEKEKESFREKMIEKKLNGKMDSLLESLRNRLVLDLDTMKKLFAQEPTTPSDSKAPSAPS